MDLAHAKLYFPVMFTDPSGLKPGQAPSVAKDDDGTANAANVSKEEPLRLTSEPPEERLRLSNIDSKEVARGIAIATSLVEVGAGVSILPIVPPLGWGLIAHGGANTLAATASLLTYSSSDGETELPTSALGMLSYGICSVSSRPDMAGMASSAMDIVDDIGSFIFYLLVVFQNSQQ